MYTIQNRRIGLCVGRVKAGRPFVAGYCLFREDNGNGVCGRESRTLPEQRGVSIRRQDERDRGITQIGQWLTQYETDVRFADVSGMEHLDMLLTRSRIAAGQAELNPEQQNRLLDADQHLLHDAEQFYRSIPQVADLDKWRSESAASPEEWWYLDVLTSVPQLSMAGD